MVVHDGVAKIKLHPPTAFSPSVHAVILSLTFKTTGVGKRQSCMIWITTSCAKTWNAVKEWYLLLLKNQFYWRISYQFD